MRVLDCRVLSSHGEPQDSTDNDDLHPLGEDTAAQSESSDNTDSMANLATAEEPVPNPGVENLMEIDQAARDKFIQNMRDLSWDEFDKIRKSLPKRPILRPANWARGDENHAWPEKLPEARDSPGVDQTSGVYQTLAEPRNDKNADSPEPWPAPENPGDASRSIADKIDSNDAVFSWSEVTIDTPEYRAGAILSTSLNCRHTKALLVCSLLLRTASSHSHHDMMKRSMTLNFSPLMIGNLRFGHEELLS
ncbi:hypothetical protein N7499_002826 [Penicillium canescens]|nr:hypothetical protein N7499_002826 [Penicillium canescens]KAJ6166441.1 hypothetical protein N7485_009685 [Penicillium canescens]